MYRAVFIFIKRWENEKNVKNVKTSQNLKKIMKNVFTCMVYICRDAVSTSLSSPSLWWIKIYVHLARKKTIT